MTETNLNRLAQRLTVALAGELYIWVVEDMHRGSRGVAGSRGGRRIRGGSPGPSLVEDGSSVEATLICNHLQLAPGQRCRSCHKGQLQQTGHRFRLLAARGGGAGTAGSTTTRFGRRSRRLPLGRTLDGTHAHAVVRVADAQTPPGG